MITVTNQLRSSLFQCSVNRRCKNVQKTDFKTWQILASLWALRSYQLAFFFFFLMTKKGLKAEIDISNNKK